MSGREVLLVAVEGNIGAGKSTLLEALRARGFVVVPEPVDEWLSSGALAEFYKGAMSPFTFQCHVLETKARALRRALEAGGRDRGVVVVERTFEVGADVFLEIDAESGRASRFECGLYRDLTTALLRACGVRQCGVVFLDASPATCLARVHGRARAGEGGVGEESLAKLGAAYGRFLGSIENLLRVPADGPVAADAIVRWIETITGGATAGDRLNAADAPDLE